MTQSHPHLQVNIEYDEYTIALSTVEDRTLCNVFVTADRGQIMTNRTVNSSTNQRKDLDFYLAGIEVFSKEAISFILRDIGATHPT